MKTSNSFFRKIRVYTLTLTLISGVMTVFTLPAHAVAPFDVTVSNFTQLQTAVEKTFAAATDDMVITVSAPLSISAILSVPAPATGGKMLTIKSASPSNRSTLTRGVTGNLFTIAYGATLVLEDIIIDGGKNGSFSTDGGGSLVRIVGACTLKDGAVLQNNIYAGLYAYGGGVHTDVGGRFVIAGGKIIGNTAGAKGGGVFTGLGVFTLNSGEISGNVCVNGEGGGVHTYDSAFTLNGGEIKGNSCLTGLGGGVYSISPTVAEPCTMNNGKISGNSATTGGGVFMTETPFVVNGGEISGNKATTDGGGVYIRLSIFTLNNGKINGNSAANDGGGIYLYSEMCAVGGGEVNGNSAANNGGGIYVAANSYNADFFLGGTAKINGNSQGAGATASASNLCLGNNRFVFLGGGDIDMPTAGMNVGVQTATEGGVFVKARANASDVNYFTADKSNSKIIHEGSQLKIGAR